MPFEREPTDLSMLPGGVFFFHFFPVLPHFFRHGRWQHSFHTDGPFCTHTTWVFPSACPFSLGLVRKWCLSIPTGFFRLLPLLCDTALLLTPCCCSSSLSPLFCQFCSSSAQLCNRSLFFAFPVVQCCFHSYCKHFRSFIWISLSDFKRTHHKAVVVNWAFGDLMDLLLCKRMCIQTEFWTPCVCVCDKTALKMLAEKY